MHCFRKVTDDLYWVGASDRRIELFENIFPLTKGVSYNSYLLLDEKTVISTRLTTPSDVSFSKMWTPYLTAVPSII